MKAFRYRIADGLARLISRLPDYVLARVVKRMADTGRGTDACLRWGALPLPVHFYSPVPDLDDLARRRVWDRRSPLAGVDFRPEAQVELLGRIGRAHGGECDWPAGSAGQPDRFFTENGCFSFGCAASAHGILRHFKPRRIVEIGSGNSSLVIAEALRRNEQEGAPRAEYTIVDPYPGPVVRGGLPGVTRLVDDRVEQVSPDAFGVLRENDVLFIDSGHTVRIGGDVNCLLLDVLPTLAPGVVVHVHDVHLPYEYPEKYARNAAFRMLWTEGYLLQAFLSLNREYEVLLAMQFLQQEHAAAFQAAFPRYDPVRHRSVSAAFWIRRK